MSDPVLTSEEVQALRDLTAGPAKLGPEEVELGRSDRGLRRHAEALDQRLQRFAVAIAQRVARLMRCPCKPAADAVDLLGPEIVAEILVAQALIAELRLPSGQVVGYLGFDLPICEAIVERSFGGPSPKNDAAPAAPTAAAPARKLTPLSQAVVQPILPLLASDLARGLGDRAGMTLAAGNAMTGAAVEIPVGTVGLFVWRCALACGAPTGSITVVLLPSALELARHSDTVLPARNPGETLARHLQSAAVTVSATLGTTRLAMADLLELRPGDVIRLDRGRDEQVPVSVAGVVKFLGMPTQHCGEPPARRPRPDRHPRATPGACRSDAQRRHQPDPGRFRSRPRRHGRAVGGARQSSHARRRSARPRARLYR